MKKRILTWLLIFVFCLALLPAAAFADAEDMTYAEDEPVEAIAEEPAAEETQTEAEEPAAEEPEAGEEPAAAEEVAQDAKETEATEDTAQAVKAAAATQEEVIAEAEPALDGLAQEDPGTVEPGPEMPTLEITSQPQDVTVNVGEYPVFRVSAEGSGLTYQWQYYSFYYGAWLNVAGATYSVMYFPAKAIYNGIYYRCVVKDAGVLEVISDYAKLTVKSAITITSQPQYTSVSVGEYPVFRVSAEGSGLSYQWQYYSSYYKMWFDIAGATYSVMYFPAKASYNGIYYHCVITDSAGGKATSNYARLTVNDTLEITKQPENVTVSAGDRATFRVAATGSGLTYQWQYYNAYYKTWIDITGAAYATMYFTTKDSYNGIYYHCVIKDSSGTIACSNYVKLTIVAGEPMPNPGEWPEWLRYELVYEFVYDKDAVFPLLLKKVPDQLDQYPEYTSIRYESEGLGIVSQQTTTEGELFQLRCSKGYPQGRVAVLTLYVMKGSESVATFVFYAFDTDRGVFVSNSTYFVWEHYYAAGYEAGEFTENEWAWIQHQLTVAALPIMEDPTDPEEWKSPYPDQPEL